MLALTIAVLLVHGWLWYQLRIRGRQKRQARLLGIYQGYVRSILMRAWMHHDHIKTAYRQGSGSFMKPENDLVHCFLSAGMSMMHIGLEISSQRCFY